MTPEFINEHYLKHGNNNLITNSNLKNNVQIYAIGDSHSIFHHNSIKIYEHWGHLVTMHTLISNNIDLFNLGTILGNGHEKYNIKSNDIVIFYYGYNDVQKNIYKYHEKEPIIEINKLVKNYIDKVLHIKITYNIIPIISCVYPVPLTVQNINLYGSNLERISYTHIMNAQLEQECKTQNILFLNIYDIINKNDYINNIYTIDGIHLDYNNNYIKNIIEDKIYNLIK